MKLIWKIEPKPTGRFSSFQARGWPGATDEHDNSQATIFRESSEGSTGVLALQYTAAKAKEGNLNLRVRVRIDSAPEDVQRLGKWRWGTLKGAFSTLNEAKAAAAAYFERTKP